MFTKNYKIAYAIYTILSILTSFVATTTSAIAIPEEQQSVSPPSRLIDIQSYVVKRGLKPLVENARQARQTLESLPSGIAAAPSIVRSAAVNGKREIPVITLQFSNTASAPYPVHDLQTELFDGPWPTGTMSDYYKEVSNGKFTVSGTVYEWTTLSKEDSYYGTCNGLCNTAKIAEMLNEAFILVDDKIDFTKYDNDGPDNIPNSSDDDGFVDFVALVHPESGGECSPNGSNGNIWSHRYSFENWTGSSFETNDVGTSGLKVKIDDYVIMPALACDSSTMIQIGVFAHEFGHAFGLPDLYDAVAPKESNGIGGWGLMASASWGGDGMSPQNPAHMSAWAKEFLGWVMPTVIDQDTMSIEIHPAINQPHSIVKVEYTDTFDPDDKNIYY